MFKTPMLFLLSFLILLTIGSVSGIIPAIDRAYHDTYYVGAHINYLMSFAVVFCVFASIYYWINRMPNRHYPEWAGILHFGTMFVGVALTLYPQYLLSQNMTREYLELPVLFARANFISFIGSLLTLTSFGIFIAIIAYTFLRGKRSDDGS